MAIYKGLEATLHEAFWGDRGSDLEFNELQRLMPDFQGKVLEVGAGSGRILKPLMDAGWNITGIEPSEEMCAMCQERGFGDAVQCTTLEDFDTEEKYDLILLTSFVLQLLPEPEEIFPKLKSLLKEGGRIYFSCFIPWAEIVGELVEGEWSLDDEVTLKDRRKARCWVNFEVNRIGQELKRQHRYEILERKKAVQVTKTEQLIRWFTLPQLRLLFEKLGCKEQSVSYDFKPEFDSDAHILGFVLTV